jgi:hypothetical protein
VIDETKEKNNKNDEKKKMGDFSKFKSVVTMEDKN